MARITVDGRQIEAKDGMSLLQALLDGGVYIPHFCYHQDLPLDGNCRQCLVEMDTPRGPAGVISCATSVLDGMVVRTNGPLIEKARRGVLEYLLVNHPVDCPVCDQAGECRLQVYYMKYGLHETRVNVEKVQKGKRMAIGPRVMLDQERCVLCRRCIRFVTHVTETHELTVGGRGDHAHITVFPGRPLDNRYSVNTVDLCPVGALTDIDFRFKCRVWYLKPTDVICPGCARGCNAVLECYQHNFMDGLNGTAYRMRPRRNPEVNKSWMCDDGRLLYKAINENRIEAPLVAQGGQQEGAEWEAALGLAAEKLAGVLPASVAGLCSPDCTNEELWLFRRFMREAVGAETVSAASLRKPGFQDDFLLRADQHPNSLGVQFQRPWSTWQEALDWISAGVLKVLVVFRNDPIGLSDNPGETKEKLGKLNALIVIDSNRTATSEAAHIVLPVGSFAEREGTYVNFQGRIQRTCRAYPPRWDAKSDIETFLGLAERLGKPIAGTGNAAQIWRSLSAAVDEFKGIGYGDIGTVGAMAQGYGAAEQMPR
jgi:NADH-quinone oxidoreductase subunit G